MFSKFIVFLLIGTASSSAVAEKPEAVSDSDQGLCCSPEVVVTALKAAKEGTPDIVSPECKTIYQEAYDSTYKNSSTMLIASACMLVVSLALLFFFAPMDTTARTATVSVGAGLFLIAWFFSYTSEDMFKERYLLLQKSSVDVAQALNKAK